MTTDHFALVNRFKAEQKCTVLVTLSLLVLVNDH